MTVMPDTPSVNEIDPASLTYICLVDRVAVYVFEEGQLDLVSDGHLVAYITSDPNSPHQVVLLRLYDYYDEEKAAIVLVSRSKAWLQENRTLIFPRKEGGLWRIDCSESNEASFKELQDVLTFFIKYENRHQMKNTLALVNPVSCEVTKVIADNVYIDRSESESVLGEEDFITSIEDERGQKLPVYVDQNFDQDSINPNDITKVKLLYQTGNAIVTGSDWLAHAIVLAGQTLAKGISNGGKILEDKIEVTRSPLTLSDKDRRIFEVVYNTTSTATQIAGGLVDKAVSTAVDGINSIIYKDEIMQTRQPIENASKHFGISALQAALKIVGGMASAASIIIESSKDSIIQVVHKKYGPDAGYMVEKTIGSGSNVAEMLVYFDARGISRRVILKGSREYAATVNKTSTSDKEVMFETDWLDESTSNHKSETSNTNTEKQKDPQILTV